MEIKSNPLKSYSDLLVVLFQTRMVTVQNVWLQQFRYHEADHLCAILRQTRRSSTENYQFVLVRYFIWIYPRTRLRIFITHMSHITNHISLHIGDPTFFLLRLLDQLDPNLLYHFPA